MPGPVPHNPKIHRIVHWQNVDYILQHGIFTRGHAQTDPNYVEIGHTQLIGQRHTYPIPDFPLAGTLGECVPFYFGTHSPMLYAIMKGATGVQQRPQDEIVYVNSRVNTIVNYPLPFFFTDQHAKAALANGYNNVADLNAIDWTVVLSRQWANTPTDLNKRDRKQAEFLVLRHVPAACILEIVVKTPQRQAQLQAIALRLNSNIPIIVDPTCYF